MIDRIIKSDDFVNFLSDKNFFVLLLIGSAIFFVFLTIFIFLESLRMKKEAKQVDSKTAETKQEMIEVEEMDNDFAKPSKTELDIILQRMQNEGDEEKNINHFETEQEEKAIISYQELLEANNNKEKINEEEEINFDDVGELDFEKEEFIEKKFRKSDFISPIYGRMNKEVEKPEEKPEVMKETINEELNVKLEEGEQFLKSLKDFRNKL